MYTYARMSLTASRTIFRITGGFGPDLIRVHQKKIRLVTHSPYSYRNEFFSLLKKDASRDTFPLQL
jgi:hypothetical protein